MKKILLTTTILFAWANLANAEDIFDKARPDYKPNGVHVGSFIFNPQLAVNQLYDDNIYSKEGKKIGDKVTKFKPAIDLRSDWNVHELNFRASADSGRYWNNSSENYDDYMTAANGKLEILDKTNLVGSVDYGKKHEDRGTPDRNLNAKNPTEFKEFNGKVGFERNLRKVSLRVYQNFKSLNFRDGVSNNGEVFSNDHRDRNQYKTTARVDYELEPKHGIFFEGSEDIRKYSNKVVSNRDSNGNEFKAGTSLNITGKTRAEAYIGYLDQNYDSTEYKDISAFNFGGSVLWSPTEMALIKFAAGRSIEETSIANYSGYIATAFSGTVEYELLRNLLLVTDLTFSRNRYESNFATPRSDDFTAFDFGTKYFFNRNLLGTLTYSNIRNASNIHTVTYIKNVIMAGLEVKF